MSRESRAMSDIEDPQTKNQTAPTCPVGERQCDVIDELMALRSENQSLSELVRTDTLTGLSNFRHFMQCLEQEMERSRRTLLPTGLIYIDLDFFKKVNDTWGHEVGNLALQQTASLMQACVRRIDIPCRYGGEEFAVILPSTDLMTSVQVAERIRESIENTPLAIEQQQLKLTASLGVDIYKGIGEEAPQSFIQRADSCLYRAKQEGRNQVCHADYDSQTTKSQVSHEEKDALFGLFGNPDDTQS